MKRQIITACVFLYKDGKALIGKRAKTKSFLPGKWELPGGHVEFGETLEECLKREMQEEFNMKIILRKPYFEFTYIMNNDSDHVIEVLYLAKMKNPSQEIRIRKKDHEDYKWISENEIGNYFADNDDEGNAIRKGFEILKIEK
ncbi:MAG: hypothetical protein A2958_01075 [Candidatus Levybacteria bacterium RIFCSPLOWO2_01_FULL_38_13]|nr:MAG: hypothetical protein A2629_00970 [Candidatus Levybacteria bacterium RIFCSPHIGHO2_01_FULL_41_15]OGH34879.1 MAG: hypothetical protein A2958_01075 [Candidatus Levybacteria bacterium RIFCSPLOWO2_01_FULL_38_13]